MNKQEIIDKIAELQNQLVALDENNFKVGDTFINVTMGEIEFVTIQSVNASESGVRYHVEIVEFRSNVKFNKYTSFYHYELGASRYKKVEEVNFKKLLETATLFGNNNYQKIYEKFKDVRDYVMSKLEVKDAVDCTTN